MHSEEESSLISAEGKGRRVVVHKDGVHKKKRHASKQIGTGEGYSVDVADESSFKHYIFVNADEYGMFDHKRRFLQCVVCYQVLSTQWNSASKKEPSPLKPRYLFLFDDSLFVMKTHDLVDTNTRRYRILGRLNLLDVSVEEVGDDMFDVVARGTGAMRFKVGSTMVKSQVVALFRQAIRKRRGPVDSSHPAPREQPPDDPDDVYAVMNYALSVLEKKLRGRASEEEQWQVDQLLKHALEMQERLTNPGLGGSTTTTKTLTSTTSYAAFSAQLAAKETQLRALEDRAATAEAALSRLRGASEDDSHKNLVLENRSLRIETDRLRAELEERDKQLRIVREELEVLKRSTRTDRSDKVYHEGSVDEILTRIKTDTAPAASSSSYKSAPYVAPPVSRYEPSSPPSPPSVKKTFIPEPSPPSTPPKRSFEPEPVVVAPPAPVQKPAPPSNSSIELPKVAPPPPPAKVDSPSESDVSSEGDEELSSSSFDEDELDAFLAQHELSYLRDELDDADCDLARLRTLNVAGVRSLGLSYADASHLATALGLKDIHT